jgi:hypothetical protein
MGDIEMTQQGAAQRAWRAAAEAESKAGLGDRGGAHAYAAVAEAWARVAGQLPVVELAVDNCPRPAAHMPAERVGEWPPGQVPVPTPRPLRGHEQAVVTADELGATQVDLGARVAAEQAAAGLALLGLDPLDPRVPVGDVEQTLVLDAPAHEPAHLPVDDVWPATNACKGCAQPIEWRGGAWVDIKGWARCVAR